MIDLLQLRNDKALTQSYVAKESKVTRSVISHYENGNIDRVINNLSKIVKVYGYELKLVEIDD